MPALIEKLDADGLRGDDCRIRPTLAHSNKRSGTPASQQRTLQAVFLASLQPFQPGPKAGGGS